MKLLFNTKLRTLFLLPLLFLTTFALVGVSIPRAHAATAISVSPASIIDMTLTPGSTFMYSVAITGLGTSLWAFQYDFLYNPTVVQAQSVDPGAFFDTLISLGEGFCVISTDNTLGDVSVACTVTTGPSFTGINMGVGVITFQVMSLGLSTQSLNNAIALHNAGGGVLDNIALAVGPSSLFANVPFAAMADLPSLDNTIHVKAAWPEKVRYSFSGDTTHTPGLLDLFANANSTGNIPALCFVKFVITSKDFGTFVVFSNSVQVAPGTFTVVPLAAIWNPVNSQGVLMIGKYHVVAQLFFQGVNPDGTLGPLTAGSTLKAFHFEVLP
jgi:hypothetical protein